MLATRNFRHRYTVVGEISWSPVLKTTMDRHGELVLQPLRNRASTGHHALAVTDHACTSESQWSDVLQHSEQTAEIWRGREIRRERGTEVGKEREREVGTEEGRKGGMKWSREGERVSAAIECWCRSVMTECRFPESLGRIFKVQLWHNNSGSSPSWYLSRVVVKDACTGQ